MTDYSYYSSCKKSTGQEFFVAAQTLIVVKLLRRRSTLRSVLVTHQRVIPTVTRIVGPVAQENR